MKEQIDKHQTCIEILEGIQYFKNRIKVYRDSIDKFPYLDNTRYIDSIEIYNKCITRLKQRHERIIKTIEL